MYATSLDQIFERIEYVRSRAVRLLDGREPPPPEIEDLAQREAQALAARVELRLPNGVVAHGIKRGHARLAFLDPRHRAAG